MAPPVRGAPENEFLISTTIIIMSLIIIMYVESFRKQVT